MMNDWEDPVEREQRRSADTHMHGLIIGAGRAAEAQRKKVRGLEGQISTLEIQKQVLLTIFGFQKNDAAALERLANEFIATEVMRLLTGGKPILEYSEPDRDMLVDSALAEKAAKIIASRISEGQYNAVVPEELALSSSFILQDLSKEAVEKLVEKLVWNHRYKDLNQLHTAFKDSRPEVFADALHEAVVETFKKDFRREQSGPRIRRSYGEIERGDEPEVLLPCVRKIYQAAANGLECFSAEVEIHYNNKGSRTVKAVFDRTGKQFQVTTEDRFGHDAPKSESAASLEGALALARDQFYRINQHTKAVLTDMFGKLAQGSFGGMLVPAYAAEESQTQLRLTELAK